MYTLSQVINACDALLQAVGTAVAQGSKKEVDFKSDQTCHYAPCDAHISYCCRLCCCCGYTTPVVVCNLPSSGVTGVG
jgi:hypothetical protein